MRGLMINKINVLKRTWSVSCDIYPIERIPSIYVNLFHFTNRLNLGAHGDRTPGVWFNPGTTKPFICSSISNNADYCFTLNVAFPLKQYTRLNISQTQNNSVFTYSITVNGTENVSIVNTYALEFTNVKVYMSNPWHQPANALIRNFKIING